MVFESIRWKSGERVSSVKLNAMIDALEQTYSLAKRGDPDKPYDELYANTGYFNDNVYVNGKPVIKDGDPITVSDLGDDAKQKITNAIDSTTSAQNIASIKDKINKINMDENGNIGVFPATPITISDISDTVKQKITQAIDTSQLLTDILNEFKPVSNKGSITASDNTSGFSIVLNKGGRPIVNVYYRLSGAGNIFIKLSSDGQNWKTFDVISLSEAGEGIKIYTGIAYQYVRVETDAVGVDVEFEITASR